MNKEEMIKVESNFLSRVKSIPIIQDSVYFANKTTLGQYAISTANTALSTVNKYQPKYLSNYYDQYIQPQVQKADELGCRSLDLIQKKYPVVNTSTQDIVQLINTEKILLPIVDKIEILLNQYLPNENQTENLNETNQTIRAYNLLKSKTINTKNQMIEKSTQQVQTNIDHLSQQLLNQLEQIKSNQNLPDWLKSNLNLLVDKTKQQLNMIQFEYQRTDIQSIEKAKNIANSSIQIQVLPLINTIQSQLLYYSDITREKTSLDLKAPLLYLGLTPTPTQ